MGGPSDDSLADRLAWEALRPAGDAVVAEIARVLGLGERDEVLAFPGAGQR
jgi:hypothetical protein